MRIKKGAAAAVPVMLISMLAGCAGGSGSGGGQAAGTEGKAVVPENNNPVELIFYSHYIANFDDYFNKIVADMVHKKYPHITVKVMVGDAKNPLFDALLSSGVNPDIIYGAQSNAIIFRDQYKAVEDLAPYIKKNNIDLSQFEPNIMNGIKSYGEKGEIYGLPMVMSPWALYYNKDLFDKFGVPYPTDGMTWDQVTEVAKKLTRNVDGIQYKGITMQMIDKMSLQLSLPYVDPKTSKAALETDGWKQLFQQMKSVWDIPNMFTDVSDIGAYSTAFDQKKTAAMVPNNNKIPNYVLQEANGFNWDVVEFPSYPDKMHVYPAVEANTLMMNSSTKHKDEVFKVISYLVSDEVQLALARTAQMSTLTGVKFQDEFGKDYPSLKNKNMKGIFKGHPAPLPPATIYDDEGLKNARAAWQEVLAKGTDINSALRSGNEKFQKAIEAKKAQ